MGESVFFTKEPLFARREMLPEFHRMVQITVGTFERAGIALLQRFLLGVEGRIVFTGGGDDLFEERFFCLRMSNVFVHERACLTRARYQAPWHREWPSPVPTSS
jgi:hypothetical protein